VCGAFFKGLFSISPCALARWPAPPREWRASRRRNGRVPRTRWASPTSVPRDGPALGRRVAAAIDEPLGDVVNAEFDLTKARIALSKSDDLLAQLPPSDEHGPHNQRRDDGPGLSPGLRQAALSPVKHLDETKPGSGLGLSIAADLASLYGAQLSLDQSARPARRAEAPAL
jgi:hypothetical protein